MKRRSFPLIAAFTLSVVLGLAGCSSPTQPESNESAPSTSADSSRTGDPDPEESSAADPELTSNASLLKSVDLAFLEVPDSVLYSVESEDGGTKWEVEVVTSDGARHEVETAADGSRVLNGPIPKGSKPKYLERTDAATLPHADIIDAALDVTAGTIIELELDTEDGGRVVWEVEIVDADGTKVELDIDPATGEVIRTSQ